MCLSVCVPLGDHTLQFIIVRRHLLRNEKVCARVVVCAAEWEKTQPQRYHETSLFLQNMFIKMFMKTLASVLSFGFVCHKL